GGHARGSSSTGPSSMRASSRSSTRAPARRSTSPSRCPPSWPTSSPAWADAGRSTAATDDGGGSTRFAVDARPRVLLAVRHGARRASRRTTEGSLPMKVLIVEDDEAIAVPLAKGLEREGLEVHRVESGSDALARASLSEFDVILLDLGLPDRDGFDVCRELR